nr:histidine kinase [Allomuricauda sp.]
MNLTEKNQNIAFWMLQFLGWGFINLLSFVTLKETSLEFLIINTVMGTLTGVFSTSILRFYLKRNIAFESFGFSDIAKIFVSTILTAVLYGTLSVGFGYVYGKLGLSVSESELKLLQYYNKVWLILFSSMFTISAWVVCYLVIKLLLKLNRDRIERLELNTNLKQAQLNTLKGQINPHFMFNSLNNIRGLMLEDVEKSREMLTKLSEILRYSLTKNNVNSIAVAEELEVIDNYIDLSKIQFENRLEFIKEIEPNTLSLEIPPMVIQLLVENAVKHGISNLKTGGRIVLSIKKEGELLVIEVRNTGKLQMAKNTTQLGLKNIRQRLKLLYSDKASFDLNENSGEVVANIKIPLT